MLLVLSLNKHNTQQHVKISLVINATRSPTEKFSHERMECSTTTTAAHVFGPPIQYHKSSLMQICMICRYLQKCELLLRIAIAAVTSKARHTVWWDTCHLLRIKIRCGALNVLAEQFAIIAPCKNIK